MKQFFLYSLTFLLSVFSLSGTASDTALPESLAELRQEHQQALQLSLNYPSRAREAHTLVAGKLEFLWDTDGINQAALAYNIGNSWFHAGRFGNSVLWYRRSEKLGYSNNQLSHNLDYARSQRLDNLPSRFGAQWLSTAHSMAGSTLFLLTALVVYLLFWWQVWQFIRSGKNEKSRLVVAASLMLFITMAFAFRISYTPAVSDGVITAMDITARKGPGLVFAPAFTSPLNQGTEFVLLQEQANWQEVQLSNGSRAWLPARATARVAVSLN